jgi:hypothetical protein
VFTARKKLYGFADLRRGPPSPVCSCVGGGRARRCISGPLALSMVDSRSRSASPFSPCVDPAAPGALPLIASALLLAAGDGKCLLVAGVRTGLDDFLAREVDDGSDGSGALGGGPVRGVPAEGGRGGARPSWVGAGCSSSGTSICGNRPEIMSSDCAAVPRAVSVWPVTTRKVFSCSPLTHLIPTDNKN